MILGNTHQNFNALFVNRTIITHYDLLEMKYEVFYRIIVLSFEDILDHERKKVEFVIIFITD